MVTEIYIEGEHETIFLANFRKWIAFLQVVNDAKMPILSDSNLLDGGFKREHFEQVLRELDMLKEADPQLVATLKKAIQTAINVGAKWIAFV